MHACDRHALGSGAAMIFMLIGICSLSISPALASLDGDSIICTPNFAMGTLTLTPSPVIVGPGVEFTLSQPGGPLFAFDFAGNILTITSLAGLNTIGQSTTFTFSSIDWPADPSAIIAGAFVYLGSTILTAGSVSYTDHTFTVELCCGNWLLNDTATIELYPESQIVESEVSNWGPLKAQYR